MMEDERLETIFQLNVKGMTQFGNALVVNGNISAEADGTASKQYSHNFTVSSSYKYFTPHPPQIILTLSSWTISSPQTLHRLFCS